MLLNDSNKDISFFAGFYSFPVILEKQQVFGEKKQGIYVQELKNSKVEVE